MTKLSARLKPWVNLDHALFSSCISYKDTIQRIERPEINIIIRGAFKIKKTAKTTETFPTGGGSKISFSWEFILRGGGVGPADKIPLNRLEFIFFRVNLYSHMHNSQMWYTRIHFHPYNTWNLHFKKTNCFNFPWFLVCRWTFKE